MKKAELVGILNSCTKCLSKDPKNENTCYYVETNEPGEIVSMDILEIGPKEKILVAIDYFSRIVFAKRLQTKQSKKVLRFIQEVYSSLPFKMLLTDNGKEFSNKLVKEWSRKMNIRHKFSVPYYHKSNGRIERVNRTIRNALRKTPGAITKVLMKVVDNYNAMVHRGIGMSPNEALRRENWEKVRSIANIYKKEFDRKNKERMQFEIGDVVMKEMNLDEEKWMITLIGKE